MEPTTPNKPSLTKHFSLTLEEAELLSELLTSDVYKVLLKVLNKQVGDISSLVLKHKIDTLNDNNLYTMASLKLRAEGAEQLLLKFSQIKQNYLLKD